MRDLPVGGLARGRGSRGAGARGQGGRRRRLIRGVWGGGLAPAPPVAVGRGGVGDGRGAGPVAARAWRQVRAPWPLAPGPVAARAWRQVGAVPDSVRVVVVSGAHVAFGPHLG